MSSLEDTFHEAMIGIYKSAQKECNYRATRFLQMVVDTGGVAAAKKLLSTSEMQSGLFELFECGRLDLTVEALVVRDEYRALFTVSELAEAKRRLDMLSTSPK